MMSRSFFQRLLSLLFAPHVRAQANLAGQVRAAETAFAKSMADRNAAAFASLIADEAVFFGGKGDARQGRGRRMEAVLRRPGRAFREPAEVEVLASGTLGFTSGPVYDPQGGRIGTFNPCGSGRSMARGRWCLTRVSTVRLRAETMTIGLCAIAARGQAAVSGADQISSFPCRNAFWNAATTAGSNSSRALHDDVARRTETSPRYGRSLVSES
jgi:hypothetical protein